MVTGPLAGHRIPLTGHLTTAHTDDVLHVTTRSWQLAEMVVDCSDRHRTRIASFTHESHAKRQEQTATTAATKKAAELEVTDRHDEAKHTRLVVEGATKIRDRLKKKGQPMRRRELHQAWKSVRPVLDEAIEHAEAEGWAVTWEEPVEGGGGVTKIVGTPQQKEDRGVGA